MEKKINLNLKALKNFSNQTTKKYATIQYEILLKKKKSNSRRFLLLLLKFCYFFFIYTRKAVE